MRKKQGKVRSPSLAKRLRRKLSIRKKIEGSSDVPRICTTKSNKHIVVQVIDDNKGVVLASAQTFGKNAVSGAKANVEGAKAVGTALAGKLKEKNITRAVYDRNGFRYHGIIAAVADSIRENGIKI